MVDLISLTPSFYKPSLVMNALLNAEGLELEKFFQDLNNAIDQYYPDLASYALEKFEKELGIPTDTGKSIEDRRTLIISLYRGNGTTTKQMIMDVVDSYTNGGANIIEHNDVYSFDISFTSVAGVPSNMDDVIIAVDRIKPAHLAYTFIYLFMSWDAFEAHSLTWDALEALNKTWDQLEAFI